MNTYTAVEGINEQSQLPTPRGSGVKDNRNTRRAVQKAVELEDCIRVAMRETSDQIDIDGHREGTDESSLTSVQSETFDTIPDSHKPFLSKIDMNGILRYGSLDTTEETGLSSVSSSSHAERKPFHVQVRDTPSSYSSLGEDRPRKRLALSPTGIRSSQPDSIHAPSPQALPSAPPVVTASAPKVKAEIADIIPVLEASPKFRRNLKQARLQTNARPRSSIPSQISWDEYGRQCILAAQSSRLNPYALHVGEFRLLRDHITQSQVTTYLNIRNSILRLWTRNPMVSVTEEEAAGCAKESRYFDLAHIAYKWLVRNGYINFGCVEVPKPRHVAPPRLKKSKKQETIVVVGAGMAGLGCARQLEGLFTQLSDQWTNHGEPPPKVIVLEGRKRIGGRVYSHPLRSQVTGSLPDGLRNTAEMGAQIITGFDHGNPLNILLRGQLGLHYHLMWDEITMHDYDGRAVNYERDILVNKIHNDLLERTSDFRIKPKPIETLEGIPEFIDVSRDPTNEEATEIIGIPPSQAAFQNSTTLTGKDKQAIPPGFAKLQGKTQVVAGNSSSRTAAQAARSAGWQLRPGISRNHSLNLEPVVAASTHPTLGATMDEAIRQYQQLIELTPQDMRLLNWHYADLEYANAAMVSRLSLSGHDQDSGNEFEGRHSEVVGGYIQVPRGLWSLPHKLDVRFNSIVKNITYESEAAEGGAAEIECTNGEVIEADRVILTSPLGVLKAKTIGFNPPLPDWKLGAIDRMGFGLLNKVVLVYERAFWPKDYDMFGLLNQAEGGDSMDPKDYSARRGRFYLLWNCVMNSGRPMLSALMAGNAAHEVEKTDTTALVREVTAKLAKTFAPQHVPAPVEVIVTRWKSDPFTRGTYSFVAPETNPADYDVMATPIGNLHFAGEATCGTHPATVHGAYLSGLRAAAEVVESLIGPIDVPNPLVPPKHHHSADVFRDSVASSAEASPLHPPKPDPRPKATLKLRFDAKPAATAPAPPTPATPNHNPYRMSVSGRSNSDHEALLIGTILSKLGDRPLKPGRPGVNPFLLFTNDHWNEVKEQISRERQLSTGSADAKASRNEVRVALGKMWRGLDDEGKMPYLERCEEAQKVANEARVKWERDVVEWDGRAKDIREEFLRENPVPAVEDAVGGAVVEGLAGGRKRVAVDYTE